MAVPSSGQLRLRADINQEINGNDTDDNVSLGTLSNDAGFTEPDNMSEFYGYSSNVTINFSGGSLGNTSIVNNNLTNGQYTPGGSVSGQYWELQVNSGYGFQGASGTTVSGLPSGMGYSLSYPSGTTYGLGIGRVRITLNGVYPQNSTNINLSVSGGTVTAIRTLTITHQNIYSGQTGVIYGYSQNVGSFGAVVQAGTYATPSNNSTTSVKVWNGESGWVTTGHLDARMQEKWQGQTGSISSATNNYNRRTNRSSNHYRMDIQVQKTSGFTSNESITLSGISSGSGSTQYNYETFSQINRGSGGGNWSCNNKSGIYIQNLGFTSSGGSGFDPRRKAYGFAYSYDGTNWAYGPYSTSQYIFSMTVRAGYGCDFGTGATDGLTMSSSGVTGCPA